MSVKNTHIWHDEFGNKHVSSQPPPPRKAAKTGGETRVQGTSGSRSQAFQAALTAHEVKYPTPANHDPFAGIPGAHGEDDDRF